MSVDSFRLSTLANLSDAERESQLTLLGTNPTRELNGEVEYVESRIRRLESRYEKSSDRMLSELKAGALDETAEIGHWLMLLKTRERLDRRRS